MRFAIVAPETSESGASAFSEGLAEVVRRRLVTLGYDNDSFSIAYSWAEYPHHGQTPEELLKVGTVNLEENDLRRESAPSPQVQPPAETAAERRTETSASQAH
jgi:hypothetical protein